MILVTTESAAQLIVMSEFRARTIKTPHIPIKTVRLSEHTLRPIPDNLLEGMGDLEVSGPSSSNDPAAKRKLPLPRQEFASPHWGLILANPQDRWKYNGYV